MNVFLIGFMSSGKTTIGKKLAQKLGRPFIDLDTMIEEVEGMSISEIFEKKGEKVFRQLEHEALKSTLAMEDAIVSCGGGAPCFHNNIDLMNEHGLTIYLKATVNELTSRLLKNGLDKRPLLQGKSPEELHDYIYEILEHRYVYYQKAELSVNTSKLNLDKLASVIFEY